MYYVIMYTVMPKNDAIFTKNIVTFFLLLFLYEYVCKRERLRVRFIVHSCRDGMELSSFKFSSMV